MRLALELGREDSWSVAARWLPAQLAGQRKQMQVTIRGVTVTIRTGTTDLEVVLASLRGEFDELIAAVPSLRHGLIVDAGGYIGTAAIVFARAYPDATVLTLEPSGENFALLTKNVAPFANIKPIKTAISSTKETIDLRDRGTGHWGLTIVETPEDNTASVIEKVDCLTVQDLLEQYGHGGIDIFKIDIEGGEYKLLSAQTDWIGNTGAICIELHDRIVHGCSQLYERSIAGRVNSKLDGEKYISLSA